MKGCQNCIASTNSCLHNNTAPVNALFPNKENSSRKITPLEDGKEPQNLESAAFMRFVQELGLPEIFDSLTDPRFSSRTTYSLSSLCLWGFYTCAFRQGSKNAMQTSIESIASPENLEGVCHLLGIEGEGRKVPHSSVVDDALSRVEHPEFNKVLCQLFDRMISKKFFYHHQDVLLPHNTFQVGVDGYWVHSYTSPHSVDEEGKNSCPNCLPRVHNKGKPNEFTTWVHVLVTFVLICEGVKLPLYVYPLKASQVGNSKSEEDFKEECEFAAASAVLPLFRERYPRTAFTFLGDALYAKKPFIRLLNQLKFEYIIVLKDGSQKNLVKRCDGLAKTEIYQKHYTHQETEKGEQDTTLQKAAWFNSVEMGDGVFTNVLRFEESIIHNDKTSHVIYKGAWLYSKKIFQNNCFKIATRGRSRWFQEDLHNTCKQRGYDIKHDMARANPNLLLVWKMLVFIAFFVTELFLCTTMAQNLKKTRSIMKFAKDMLQQFVERSWEVISMSPILQKPRVQFRFYFSYS